jgi:hypothetical protein
VRRIEFEDPTWNGGLIGLGVAAAGGEVGCLAAHGGAGCVYLLALSAPLGYLMGDTIDFLINRPIYEAPGGHASITLSPLLGARRIGFAARARF